MNTVGDYFRELCDRFGDGWNRFWYTPSDAYTLSFMRLLTGLLALYMHFTLLPDIATFFADGGWLPPDAVSQMEGARALPSYLNHLSSPTELKVAHVAGLVILGMFAAGFFTRIASVLALVVVVSTVNRAPMLCSQLEPVVIMVMFYLCFAPAGAYFSLDAWLKRRAAARENRLVVGPGPQPSFATNIATRLIQVHLAMLYAVMGLSKLFALDWWTGSGVWWLITRAESRLVDLTGLAAHPYLVNFWTHAIVVFELAFAILIWNRLARPLLLGVAVVMWLLTALVTGNIAFSLMMLIANLAYVSPEALRSFFKSFARGREHRPTAAEPLEAKIV